MGDKKHSFNIVFTLALLGIFALSALFVAVLGAQVYGRTAEQMDDNYNARTSLVYITEKIRQCPSKNVSIDEVDGKQALVLNQDIDGKKYESWIFSANGKLKETTVLKGEEVKPEGGQEIMDLNDFSLTLTGDLMKIVVFDQSGNEDSVIISIRD